MTDKNAVLFRIRVLKRELEDLESYVAEMNDSPPAQTPPAPLPSDEWLDPKQICDRLNIAYSTFWEWLKEGKLPPGLKFSEKATRWRLSDILEWRERLNGTTVNITVSTAPKRRGRPLKSRRKEEVSSE